MRKVCTFCGCETDYNNKSCASCGSNQFLNICPNCGNKYEGSFCNACGVRFDDVEKTCPQCGKKYYTDACPDCGFTFSKANQSNTSTPVQTSTYVNNGRRFNGGVAAMICSILGLCTCSFIFSILGIIFARTSMANGDDSKTTKNALVLGIVGFVMSILFVVLYVTLGIASAR